MGKKTIKQGGRRRNWIIVKQVSTGRWFHDHSEMRTTYQRDSDFQVQPGTWGSRALAQERIKALKKEEAK